MATGASAEMTAVERAPAILLWFPGQAGSTGGGGIDLAPRAGRLLSGPGSSILVLMIEDDPAIAEMYRVQLEHDGYRVAIATTAEVGITTVTEKAPDIVLLDLLLPDR